VPELQAKLSAHEASLEALFLELTEGDRRKPEPMPTPLPESS